MSKTASLVILYAAVVFTALTVLALWPVGANRILVVVPSQVANTNAVLKDRSHQHAFSMLAGSGARIIDQVSSNSFIVVPPLGSDIDFVRTLYGSGALLVINAAGDFGCSDPRKPASFRRELS